MILGSSTKYMVKWTIINIVSSVIASLIVALIIEHLFQKKENKTS